MFCLLNSLLYNQFMRTLASVMLAALLIICSCCSNHQPTDFCGKWQGALRLPGIQLRVAFAVSSPDGAALQALLYRPDETEDAIPATSAVMRDGMLVLCFNTIGARFTGQLRKQELHGSWQHGDRRHTLKLKRVSAITFAQRPQTPRDPPPYKQQEVVFRNLHDGVRLCGTLTWLDADRPSPAAIIIQGVGAHDRNGYIKGHKPYLVLADHLTRSGLAVLRFDKRGVGRSSGDPAAATSLSYARDVIAGLNWLRRDPRVDPARVGLVGHSEGGIIAGLAAAEDKQVAFVVLLASPSLPGREYHLQFERSMAHAMGMDDAAISERQAFQQQILDIVSQESDSQTAEEKITALYRARYPDLPVARLDAACRRFLSPWFRFSLAHDPAVPLSIVSCPVLALYGEKDVQVPPQGNSQRMKDILAQRAGVSFLVRILPDLNHFLQTAETGLPAEYGQINETMSPAALTIISDWITRQVRDHTRDARLNP